MATEFMLTLRGDLIATKKVAETTADAYLKTLTILNEKKPFKNLNFLKKSEDILKRVAEYADSTQKAVLATIVSVLSLHTETPAKKKLYELYREKMMGKIEDVKKEETANEGKKTAKQTENWMTWEEVNEKKKALQTEVEAGRKKKTLLVGEYDHLLSLVILSLYTDTQPRRNLDYQKMLVVKSWKEGDAPEDNNYYDLKGQRFIFNKFKTAKTYGRQIVELPETLKATLTYYIKRHPLAKEMKTGYPLLVDAKGEPLTAVNAITRVLNKIFGKKVGSSMLRHIFITDKYGGAKTEMEKDATAMGHSVAEQQKVYNVPKERCESVVIPTTSST